MKIISVVGARPNFIKIAPFIQAIYLHNQQNTNIFINHILVHTGQHYDENMSKVFFDDLGIPVADINLGVGSGSHAEQAGYTMIEFEKVLNIEKPDWIVVVGDVNASLACSITGKKLGLKCCHIEAGLRSRDMSMPEEINRLVTDRICDLLLTPDRISSENLKNEGIPEERIGFVGNIMIDALDLNKAKAEEIDLNNILEKNVLHSTPLRIENEGYGIITLHRPSNVDRIEILKSLLDFLTNEVSAKIPLVWPIHPRTFKRLEQFGLLDNAMQSSNLIFTHPIGYLEMLRLNMTAKIMITDSGGLQEECTVLGTPCLTLRSNTERPITLSEYGGVCILVGNDISRIRSEYNSAINKKRKSVRPELWDGNTAGRCLEKILNFKE
jgi:UDP-N-acetylglucosamine 2-epimerase (non-hydrolysing)